MIVVCPMANAAAKARVGSDHHSLTSAGAGNVPAPQLATSTLMRNGTPRRNLVLPDTLSTKIDGHSHEAPLPGGSGRSIWLRPWSPVKYGITSQVFTLSGRSPCSS
jgi:hypothetical protein